MVDNNMKGRWWNLHTLYVNIIFYFCVYDSVESIQYAYPYSSNFLGIKRNYPGHIAKKDFSAYMKAMNTKNPESWTGRWLPESSPTELPSTTALHPGNLNSSVPFALSSNSSKSEQHSFSSLNPENVTTSSTVLQKDPITNFLALLSSLVSDTTPESWSGRWLPESTTAITPLSDQLKSVQYDKESEPSIKYSLSTKLRNDSLMSRPEESWTGRWLPERITSRPNVQQPASQAAPVNSMWQMINSTCDDGKTNLTVDWDGDPVNYTCYDPHNYFEPNHDLPNLIIKSAIPKAYKAKHACMNTKLEYPTDLPTFGTHRPAWPKYGEYTFLPKQRWLHNLEHGAVVMLYHPCAHPVLVNELKEMVASCLYRHIISPYTLLPPDRPMALLTWGWAMLLTSPDKRGVRNFIREHALRGPEATSKNGQFSQGLIIPAKIITDVDDNNELGLCPQTLF
ncbi:unnamed protein product [Nezara viridula]|uniref:Tumor protein p53-inducible protein 13 n=1 Tax=Nezara viridula TaxID=85310 RepID=A0A9P0HML2_NEZVI|nr:unnamed protein product [Nezara viridula]